MLTELVAAISLFANASALIIVRRIISVNKKKPGVDDAGLLAQSSTNPPFNVRTKMPEVQSGR